MSFQEDIQYYINASYPSLYITTPEEVRISKEIFSSFHGTHVVYEWDSLVGLSQRIDEANSKTLKDTDDPIKMLLALRTICLDSKQNCIFVLKDFHLQLEHPLKKVNIIRAFKNLVNLLKSRAHMVLFVAPVTKIPVELSKEIQLFDYLLPNEEAIEERLEYIVGSVNLDKKPKDKLTIADNVREASVEAAKGMTATEIENAFSLAICRVKQFNGEFVKIVFNEKIQQVKKGGLLTYLPTDILFDNVGGLLGVKEWIQLRSKGFSKQARAYGLPYPKGIGLAGVPGCGKTLISKAIANELHVPLFRLDIGKLFSKYVGETEQNTHEMIRTVESLGRCVLQIDEVEKYLNEGATSGTGDSGTGSRSFGTILSWMEDRNNPAFIVMTSNDHLRLPPALIRPGRVDLWFWVDLPDKEERVDVFEVVIRKYKRDKKNFELEELAANSVDFSGAEIDQAFQDAMFKAFSQDSEVEQGHVMNELSKLVPQSKINAVRLREMREKVEGNLTLATGNRNVTVTGAATRKLKT